eukprot:7849915-Pyramimonas_sp.AAC.1
MLWIGAAASACKSSRIRVLDVREFCMACSEDELVGDAPARFVEPLKSLVGRIEVHKSGASDVGWLEVRFGTAEGPLAIYPEFKPT